MGASAVASGSPEGENKDRAVPVRHGLSLVLSFLCPAGHCRRTHGRASPSQSNADGLRGRCADVGASAVASGAPEGENKDRAVPVRHGLALPFLLVAGLTAFIFYLWTEKMVSILIPTP